MYVVNQWYLLGFLKAYNELKLENKLRSVGKIRISKNSPKFTKEFLFDEFRQLALHFEARKT